MVICTMQIHLRVFLPAEEIWVCSIEWSGLCPRTYTKDHNWFVEQVSELGCFLWWLSILLDVFSLVIRFASMPNFKIFILKLHFAWGTYLFVIPWLVHTKYDCDRNNFGCFYAVCRFTLKFCLGLEEIWAWSMEINGLWVVDIPKQMIMLP